MTMAACAASILHWNAIPVFADIDPITLNIDINSVKKIYQKERKQFWQLILVEDRQTSQIEKIINKKR